MSKKFINALNITSNQNICLINMPVPHRKELEILPKGVTITSRPSGKFDQVILFTNTKNEVEQSWDRLLSSLKDEASLWLIYPQSDSGIFNEINDLFIDELIKNKQVTLIKKITLLINWEGIEIKI